MCDNSEIGGGIPTPRAPQDGSILDQFLLQVISSLGYICFPIVDRLLGGGCRQNLTLQAVKEAEAILMKKIREKERGEKRGGRSEFPQIPHRSSIFPSSIVAHSAMATQRSPHYTIYQRCQLFICDADVTSQR